MNSNYQLRLRKRRTGNCRRGEQPVEGFVQHPKACRRQLFVQYGLARHFSTRENQIRCVESAAQRSRHYPLGYNPL